VGRFLSRGTLYIGTLEVMGFLFTRYQGIVGIAAISMRLASARGNGGSSYTLPSSNGVCGNPQ
jgi:hypothetical protein